MEDQAQNTVDQAGEQGKNDRAEGPAGSTGAPGAPVDPAKRLIQPEALSSQELNEKVLSAVLDKSDIGKALEAAGLDRESLKQLLPGQIEKFQKDIMINTITNRFLMELLRDIHITTCGRSRTEKITEKYWRAPCRAQGLYHMIGEQPAGSTAPGPGLGPQAPLPQITQEQLERIRQLSGSQARIQAAKEQVARKNPSQVE